MDYKGPTKDDLANIRALNRYFLIAIAETDSTAFGELATRRLTESERARLAGVPFLLFSFREQDSGYWQRVLSDDPQIELSESHDLPSERVRHLQVAGLGFLWQLARRNPYVTRVASGAPSSWCEQLAASTLARLLDRAATRSDLLCARFADKDHVWRRLLGSGIHAQRSLRRTSHHCALQVLLTRGREVHREVVSAAACSMQDPVRRRAFGAGDSARETKV
jgi:hypothetical protein